MDKYLIGTEIKVNKFVNTTQVNGLLLNMKLEDVLQYPSIDVDVFARACCDLYL